MRGIGSTVALLLAIIVGSTLAVGARGTTDSGIGRPQALPLIPSALALDPRSGHVFVAGMSPLAKLGHPSVVMLDGRTGQILHTTVLSETATPAWLAIDGTTGRAFVALIGGGFDVATLDTATGALLRAVPSTRPVESGPRVQSSVLGRPRLAVDEKAGRVLMLNPLSINNRPASSISVLDARTGVVSRTVSLSSAASFDALAVDTHTGNAFLTTTADKVLTFSPASGRIIGSASVMTRPAALAVDGAAGHVVVASAGPPSAISVLAARDGRLLATVPLSTSLFLSPYAVAVDEVASRAFVLNRGAYNPATGEPTGLGSVLVLDTRTGQLLSTVTLGHDTGALAVDPDRGRVVVVNFGTASNVKGIVHVHDDGALNILDASSGAVLRTIPARGNPEIAAIDPRSGRVMVAGVRSAHGQAGMAMAGYVMVLDPGQ